MSLFPFISSADDLSINNTYPLYKEVAWDFKSDCPILENGNFKIVEGNEAIKIWVYKALLVPRYHHLIYSWDYGSELMDLIGKAYTPSLIKSQAISLYMGKLISTFISTVLLIKGNKLIYSPPYLRL